MPSPAERLARRGSDPASSAEKQQPESRASNSRPEQRQEITASSPAWARLAVLQSNSRQPPEDTLARFERAFARLQVHCPDSAERIGDFIVKGQGMPRDKGKRTSLLELTEAVVMMLDTAAQSGGIPKMKSWAEPVALLVTTLQAP